MSTDSAIPVPGATPAVPAISSPAGESMSGESTGESASSGESDGLDSGTDVRVSPPELSAPGELGTGELGTGELGTGPLSSGGSSVLTTRPNIDAPAAVRYLDSPLLRRGFWPGLACCAAVLAGGGLLGFLAGGWTGVAAAVAAIAVTGWPFYTPVRITVGPHGVLTQAMWRKYLLRWTRVAKIEFKNDAFVLVEQPREVHQHPARTEIPWNSHRDQLEPLLRFYLSDCLGEGSAAESRDFLEPEAESRSEVA